MLIRRIARPLLVSGFHRARGGCPWNPKPAADAARPALDGDAPAARPDRRQRADQRRELRAGQRGGAGGRWTATLGDRQDAPIGLRVALAFTVIPGSLGGHMFWNQDDPQRKADERRAFMTDLSLLGGLIIAAVDTEGKPSLGWRGRRAARKVSEAVTAALPVGAASGGTLADSALRREVGTASGTRPASGVRSWRTSRANAPPEYAESSTRARRGPRRDRP